MQIIYNIKRKTTKYIVNCALDRATVIGLH